MDRSVRSLVIVTLIIAAIFVAMNRVAQSAPLGDWWLVAALLLVALLLYIWDWRAGGTASSEPLVEPGQSSLDGYRPVVSAPSAASAPAIAPPAAEKSAAEHEHDEIVKAYSEIRDTDVRSDVMASAATTDTQEARAVKGMVQNIMDVGAMGTFEEVDEIAGSPEGSMSQDRPRTTPPAVKVETPAAPPAPVKAEAPPAPVQAEVPAAPPPAPAKPKAAPKAAKASKPDDLTVIEGIGPKMSAALVAGGIDTYAKLAQASEEQINAAIVAAGMRFAPSVPTWAEQAGYAVKGDMDGLKTYQATLKGGRKK